MNDDWVRKTYFIKYFCNSTFIFNNYQINIAVVKGISKLSKQILQKISDLFNNWVYKDKALQKVSYCEYICKKNSPKNFRSVQKSS